MILSMRHVPAQQRGASLLEYVFLIAMVALAFLGASQVFQAGIFNPFNSNPFDKGK